MMKHTMSKAALVALVVGSVVPQARAVGLATDLEGFETAITGNLAILTPAVLTVATAAVGYWFLKWSIPQILGFFSRLGKKS